MAATMTKKRAVYTCERDHISVALPRAVAALIALYEHALRPRSGNCNVTLAWLYKQMTTMNFVFPWRVAILVRHGLGSESNVLLLFECVACVQSQLGKHLATSIAKIPLADIGLPIEPFSSFERAMMAAFPARIRPTWKNPELGFLP